MKNLFEYLITQNRAGSRQYVCTWYRKDYPDNVVTTYEIAKNVAEIKTRMRRTNRILVTYKRDINYEYQMKY